MSEATAYKIHCSECLKPVPDDATYCPFCGRAVMASTRAERAREQFGTGIVEADEVAEESTEAESGIAAWFSTVGKETYLVAAIVVAGLLGGVAITWLALGPAFGLGGGAGWFGRAPTTQEPTAQTGEERPTAVAEQGEGPDLSTVEIGSFSYDVGTDRRTDHQTSVVAYEGERVVRLYTSRASGFESLQRRTHAVRTRLEWMARRHIVLSRQGRAPEVSTRRRGDRWEVVWNDGEVSYRLLRISSEDVRHWNQRPGEQLTGRELARAYAREVDALLGRVVEVDSNV